MRMKSAPILLKKVSSMKRFLLSSLILLTLGRTAFAYENDRVVQVPPMSPELIQLDTPTAFLSITVSTVST